jgi:hypothetical protein
MAAAPTFLRMPTLAEVVPAGRDLAYLVDVAGGLEMAARLAGTTPAELVDWLTGAPTAGLTLATRRLGSVLAARVGWSASPDESASEAMTLRAVA